MNGGVLINLNSVESLELYFGNGIYGTRMKLQIDKVHYPTLSDYCSLKNGDKVFFFCPDRASGDRSIYGIGKIINIVSNYHRSSFEDPPDNKNKYLWPEKHLYPDLWKQDKDSKETRWVILFEPSPAFFKRGVDMDALLKLARPDELIQVRTFSGVSFKKLMPEETKLLEDVIVRTNLLELREEYFLSEYSENHKNIEQKLQNGKKWTMDPTEFLLKRGVGAPEGLIQAWITYKINHENDVLREHFGRWNFVINQYPASPLKPASAMDRIDIFGFETECRGDLEVLKKYKIIEVKKNTIDCDEPVSQTMKYVDWVANSLCGGDYRMVEAFLVARDFSWEVSKNAKQIAKRTFILPTRPYPTHEWNNLNLKWFNLTNKGLSIEEL